jgi:hypothetical protein
VSNLPDTIPTIHPAKKFTRHHNNGVQIRYVIILSCMLALLLSTSCSNLIACCYLCWWSDTIVAVLELCDLKIRSVETNK